MTCELAVQLPTGINPYFEYVSAISSNEGHLVTGLDEVFLQFLNM